ncbi:MAG TPA: hypothetical protein VNZ26_04060, partial [Vicinamibacterales bacterium]|nr:hypothetical protein [Vicinamibacterales bacterium]
MTLGTPASLNARTGSPPRPGFLIWTGVATAILGALTAFHYHRLGLTLSHYDSRGHLIVARRIVDSITPGWQQIGAVWLPLPHLLNAIPVQVDVFYRTGVSAVAISIVCFAVASYAIARMVFSLTGSAAAALVGAAVFALNPNVLYLQSTPMTEPLLLALTTLGVALLIDRSASRVVDEASHRAGGPGGGDAPRIEEPYLGGILALACLTRYEAWPVVFTAIAGLLWARWRRGEPLARAVRESARLAVYPATAIVGFSIFSRIVIGQWFVSGGFFVPENKSLGDLLLSLEEIAWGTRELSGSFLTALGALGVSALIITGLTMRRRAERLIATALLTDALIPWAAFFKGHPFRIRYMVPLVAMEAVGAGVLVGLTGKVGKLAGVVS